MLQTLDPHSSFMGSEECTRSSAKSQEGHYYGLGITIQVIDQDITVQGLFKDPLPTSRAFAAET